MVPSLSFPGWLVFMIQLTLSSKQPLSSVYYICIEWVQPFILWSEMTYYTFGKKNQINKKSYKS